MACDDCIDAYSSPREFMYKVIELLQCILDENDDECIIMCDDQGGGTIVQFIRCRYYDEDGVAHVEDFEMDWTTPYTPTGTVVRCDEIGNDVEILELCDYQNDGTFIPFLRHITTDSAGSVTVVDTELNGAITYLPTGVVTSCEYDDEIVLLCDEDQGGGLVPFLRHIRSTIDGDRYAIDTELDGVTPYVIAGVAVVCDLASSMLDMEVLVLCDYNAPNPPVQFLRFYQFLAGGLGITPVDTTLAGDTPYNVTGTAGTCCLCPEIEVICKIDSLLTARTPFKRLVAVDPISGTRTSVGDFTQDLSAAYTITGVAIDCRPVPLAINIVGPAVGAWVLPQSAQSVTVKVYAIDPNVAPNITDTDANVLTLRLNDQWTWSAIDTDESTYPMLYDGWTLNTSGVDDIVVTWTELR